MLGASGGLGNAVVHELVAQGRRVRGATRSGHAIVPPGVEVTAADLTGVGDARRACEGAAVVYHCANVPYRDWVTLLPPMMDAVIEGASSAGAKLVYGDNLYMYGPTSRPLTEDLPYAATTRKGRVRADVAERLMAVHQRGQVRATIGRGSDFFGPGVTLSAMGERVFPAAIMGKTARTIGNPDAPHTYTYVGDFARALITLGERDEALGKTWHVPNPETVTTRRFVELVYEAAGSPLKLQAAPRILLTLLGLFDPGIREVKEMLYEFEEPFVVDHSKFDRAFGAQPTPLAEAIRQTVAWYRQRERL